MTAFRRPESVDDVQVAVFSSAIRSASALARYLDPERVRDEIEREGVAASDGDVRKSLEQLEEGTLWSGNVIVEFLDPSLRRREAPAVERCLARLAGRAR